MKHTCHIPPCKAECPAAHLFCYKHWDVVPADLKQDVYRTVKLRGVFIDKTWAPWWRAQSAATVFVLRKEYPAYRARIDKIEQKDSAFADQLESRKIRRKS